jgi:hypothetical protein
MMEARSSSAGSKPRRARGKWTSQQCEQMITESREPGASVSEVAHRHGVRVALLSGWRRKSVSIASKAAPVRFASVEVKPTGGPGVIEIDLSSRCVRVHGVVDGAMLREVLAAVR